MSAGTVLIKWVEGEMFVGQDRYGNSIVLGSTPGRDPEFRGVKPSDLLLLGLIGCSGYDVASVLQKQRQALTALEISATGEQADEPPFQFTRIHTHYRLCGKNLNEQKIARAIQLSEERYCTVFATLRAGVQLTSDYVIEEVTT